MSMSTWSAARALLLPAGLLMAAAASVIAHRAAEPCSGSIREVSPISSGEVDALPVIAGVVPVGEPKRSRAFFEGAHVEGTYALGDLRVGYSYYDYRGIPAPAGLDIGDPRSCDGGSIQLGTGMYAERGGLALRRSPAGGPYAITWRDPSVDSTHLQHLAFVVDPPSPLRRLRRYAFALVVLLLGALAGLRAWRRVARSAAYFGPAGIATWRAGHVDARGWIVPTDGSPAVRAALTGFAPGVPVVFSTDRATRAWTFRRMGTPSAAAVVSGSLEEVAAGYAAEATSALRAAALALVAAASALVALTW
jgi:hypothetical protein